VGNGRNRGALTQMKIMKKKKMEDGGLDPHLPLKRGRKGNTIDNKREASTEATSREDKVPAYQNFI